MAGNHSCECGNEAERSVDDSPAGKLLRGSIDSHIHFAPDVQPRRFTALEAALEAREAGMRAILIKNHSYPTAPLAGLISELVPGIEVFGSVCLDHEVGGLNFDAVETSAKLGGKIVWMPVFCAANSMPIVAEKLNLHFGGPGISIIDATGRLLPVLDDILEVIKEHDMTLATGHISPREIFALVEKARGIGIANIVVTHAMSDFLAESILTAEERQDLAREGILIEHTAWEISPTGGCALPADIVAAIKSEGAENCIMSTDFGGLLHPNVPEGMRMFIGAMLKYGLTEDEVELMVKVNPARILGLESEVQG